MFKRLSRSEERKSLLEPAVSGEERRQEEEQGGCACFANWLVYIFVKVFD